MYKAFFGLRAKPFRLNPDPRFLFASRGAKRALDFLKYGLYQREGLVLLTGGSGVGKSLLVRDLIGKLPGDRVTVAQVQPLLGDAAMLLRQIAAAFGAPTGRDHPLPLIALQRHLIGEAQAGRRALLVVDEAQNLDAASIEMLRMLSNLQIGAASAVQIFLVARPLLRRTLADAAFESLRQRIVAANHLDALDVDEVGPYVGWRMQRAGWSHPSPFDDTAIEAVTAATAAVPRRINTLCERLLMQAFVDGRTSIRGEDIAPVLDELRAEWAPELAGPAESAAAESATAGSATAGSATAGSAAAARAPIAVTAGGVRPAAEAPASGSTGRAGTGRAAGHADGFANGAAGTGVAVAGPARAAANGAAAMRAGSAAVRTDDPPLLTDDAPGDSDGDSGSSSSSGYDGDEAVADTDGRLATLESRLAALEASTAQVAKMSRAILGRIDAGKPV